MEGEERRSRDERGFTLLELTIAIGISALIFSALAQTMFAGLRSLSAQKTRNQGNEIAAQGIEDLQRFGYASLGLCEDPPVRTGFTDVARLPNCPSPLPAAYGTEPCSGAVAVVQIPRPQYPCTRGGVAYTVTRYIVWTDASRTAKRLAVFVSWRDQAGEHEVAQQSSVRIPGVANVIGLSAPVLGNATVTPATLPIADDGTLQGTVSLQVTAAGLSATDRVISSFVALNEEGSTVQTSVALASADGTTWTATIKPDSGVRFAMGSQFFSYSALRAADSKATAVVTPGANKFCTAADPTCAAASLPSFVGLPTVPSTVAIDPSGALKQDVPVSAKTKNVAPTDNVSVAVVTASGLLSVLLQPAADCTVDACTWNGNISRSAGHAFLPGSQPFSFTAEQVVADGTTVRMFTTALASGPVKFQ